MPFTHRGDFVGSGETSHGGHAPKPRIIPVSTKPNRFVRPVADSQGRPFEKAYTTEGNEMKGWNADIEAGKEFKSHERVKGEMKPMKKSSGLSQSIDKVGPMYSATVYDPSKNNEFQSTVGTWTKRGSRRVGKKLAEVAEKIPEIY
jgi:hypothetical protein